MIENESDHTEQQFKNLDIAHAHIKSVTFHDCTFDHCRFTEVVFQNCRFVNCVFKDCDLSLTQIPNCSFAGTRFTNTKIIGVNWTQAHWPEEGIWSPVEFKKCALNHSTFLGLDLSGIKMERCEAINIDFREANLSQADFAFTDLKDSLFQSTILTGADLSNTVNYQIDPSQNNIQNARFSLPEAMALLYSMDIQIVDP
jgi:uncharacterized protein YjbI with pentapeptide repeats